MSNRPVRVWCLVWVLAVPAVARAATPRPFDRLLPADTVLYVSVPHFDTFETRLRATALGRLWARPDMQPFVQRVRQELATLLDRIHRDTRIPVADLIRLPHGQLALGVSMLPDEADVRWIVLVDVGPDRRHATRTMEGMVASAIETGARKETSRVGKTTVTTVHFPEPARTPDDDAAPPPAGEGPPTAPNGALVLKTVSYCHCGSLLVMTNRPSGIQAVLDRLAGAGGPALHDNKDYRTVRDRLHAGAQVYAFVDVAHMVTPVASSDRPNRGPGSVGAALRRLGLEQMRGVGASLDFGTPAYEIQLKAFVSVRSQDKGVTRLFHFPPRPLAPEPFVPDDVAAYSTTSWDIARFHDELETVLERISPALVKSFKDRLGGDHPDAVDVRRDLVTPLGGRVSMYWVYARPLMLESAKNVVTVALKDASAFQAGFERLLRRLDIPVERRQYMGHTVYMPNSRSGITITITGTHLVFSPSVTLIEDLIRRGGRQGGGLAELALYRAGAGVLPPRASAVSFTNMTRVAEYFHHLVRTNQIAQALGVLSGGRLADLIAALDGSDLPTFDVVRPYFAAPAVGYVVQEKDGLRIQSTYLKPPSP